MLKEYDTMIMGAGLGALTLAIHLRRRVENIKILIEDKAIYSQYLKRI